MSEIRIEAVDRSEASLPAARIARRLFELMPDWDRFDKVLHELVNIIAINNGYSLEEVGKFYDLTELLDSAKHYRALLDQIIAALEGLYVTIGGEEDMLEV